MATYKPKYIKPIKYSPGTINIDIMSLIFVILIVGFILYLAHRYWFEGSCSHDYYENKKTFVGFPVSSVRLGGIATRLDVLNDPYIPPVKMDGYVWEKTSGDVRGLPPIISPIEVPITPTYNICTGSGYLPVNVENQNLLNL